MDYKGLIENYDFSSPAKVADWIWNATCAITDLLARAEEAESEAERWKMAHNQAAVNFQQENKECNKVLSELKAAEARAEKAERERDAAVNYMRRVFGWCTGCVHFTGNYGMGCKIGKMSDCSVGNDSYEFYNGEE